jgi:hypothetical protein
VMFRLRVEPLHDRLLKGGTTFRLGPPVGAAPQPEAPEN